MSAHKIEREIQRFCDSHGDAIDIGNGNTLKVDTIDESTPGSGVSIDEATIQTLVVSSTADVAGQLAVGGNVELDGAATQQLNLPRGTPATATGGAATLNATTGKITTAALTTAAGALYALTVSNSVVSANSIVLCSVTWGTATAGTPTITHIVPTGSGFTVQVQNIHASDAFNGTLVFLFVVLGAAS